MRPFTISNDWQAAGVGETGEAATSDDIMWQTSTGHVYQWLGRLNGNASTFAWKPSHACDVGTNFHAQPLPNEWLLH